MTPHRFYRATFAACALIVASVIASPNLASAETHNPNETVQTSSPFGQFLVGDIVGRARGALVLREDRLAGIECDEARNVETYGVEIVSPVTMNEGDAAPSAGVWHERVRISGCGITRIYNGVYRINDEGQLGVIAIVSGTTPRRLSDLRDLRPMMEARADLGDCETRNVYAANAGAPEGYTRQVEGGSYDTWTVQGCGQSVDLVLLFAGSADGTVQVSIEAQLPSSPE